MIGADPGQSGAFSRVTPAGEGSAFMMPVLDKRINLVALGEILDGWPDERTVVIETVSTRPGQGRSSALTIGINYGLVVGFLRAKGYRVVEVHPQKWKAAMGLTKRDKSETPKQSKDRSIALAQTLFPGADLRKSDRSTVPKDGKAEALLIAEYARRNNL